MNFSPRTGIAVAFFLFSHCVFAGESSQSSCHHYDGFYLGANLGVSSLSDKESTNNPIHDVHYLGAAGIIGGGLLGYDFTLKEQWKLGLEGFINATDITLSDNQNYAPQTSYTVDMYYNTGLRLLPGYEFTPRTIGHLIIGYSYAKFAIKDNGNYGTINTQFQSNGLQLGLGMNTIVFNNFSLRADMLYTLYASQSSKGLTTTTPPSIQVYSNNLSTLEGNLALIYKFA